MIFNLAATFISAALLVPNVVLGQAPTNTSQIPACILNCTLSSLTAGDCGSVANVSCICTSIPFQTATGACITANCPTEATTASQLQNATCAAVGSSSSSSSASGSHSTTGTASPGPSTTHPASSSTTTTSSSAGFHTAGIASGVALALFGAAFSLF